MTDNITNHFENLTPLKLSYIARKTRNQAIPTLNEPIAVIGVGCNFPGNANNPDSYWNLLINAHSGIIEIPKDRWDIKNYFDSDKNIPGKMYSRFGGFINDPELFDAEFFNIPRREAISIDPQHRLLLEVTWETLEHAGYAPNSLMGSSTGVFIGMFGHDYMIESMSQPADEIDAYMGIGNFHSVAAGRISYFLGLQGPSIAVDAACASSLVSVHLACQSLRVGECQLALAGGVNRIITPEFNISYCKAHMLSPDSKCHAFDNRANGFIRGEGCGMVLLKRLSDAIADGDSILALVRGSAVNQDGVTSSLTVPNGPAQQRVIRQALKNSAVQASDISYIEAHGTGTPIGDPIEFGALAEVYGKAHNTKSPLWIGSVKTNIGHLEGAAGIAGFIKTVLSLHYKTIPPQLNFKYPNKKIDWARYPIQVCDKIINWSFAGKNRYAAVSSFGLSGTNAHLILQNSPELIKKNSSKPILRPAYLFTLSAKSEAALQKLVTRYIDFLKNNMDLDIASITYTLNVGRQHFKYRLAIIVKTIDEIISSLQKYITKSVSKNENNAYQTKPQVLLKLVEDINLALKINILYNKITLFREAVDDCIDKLDVQLQSQQKKYFSENIVSESTTFRKISCFILQYAYAKLWLAWGIKPEAISVTKTNLYLAATLTETIPLSQALNSVANNNNLISDEILKRPVISLIDSKTGIDLTDIIWKSEFWEHKNTSRTISQENHEYNLILACIPENNSNSRHTVNHSFESLLNSLTHVYLQGVEINWNSYEYYNKPSPNKLRLPTYPFLPSRFWINKKRGINNTSKNSMEQAIHPLIHKQEANQKMAFYFSSCFNGNEFVFNDHCINGNKIFPAVAYLEMIRAAGSFKKNQSVVMSLHNITWQHSMVINNAPLRVKLSCTHQGHFTIFDDQHIYVDGDISFDGQPLKEIKKINIDSFIRNLDHSLDPNDCYQEYMQQGIQYGDQFKCLQEIYYNQNHVLATARLEKGNEDQKYFLHPGLLDSVLQSLIVFNKFNQSDALYLPFTLESIHIYHALPKEIYALGHIKDVTNDYLRKYDFTITDQYGQVLVEIRDLCLKSSSNFTNKSSVCYFYPIWKEIDFSSQQISATNTESLLLFIDDKTMKDILPFISCKSIIVAFIGDHFQQIDATNFIINASKKSNYHQLINQLLDQNLEPTCILFHATSQPLPFDLLALINLSQTLTELGCHFGNRLYYLSTKYLDDGVNLQPTALVGFFKTQYKEDCRRCWQTLRIEETDIEKIATCINHEISIPLSFDFHIYYDALGNRKVRNYSIINPTELHASNTLNIPTEPVILISGGSGGLGQAFAQFFLQHYQAKVILLGRSKSVDLTHLKKITKKKQGVVNYFQADVTNKKQMQSVFKEIRKQYNTIHGVIHSAAVIQDSLLINKSKSQVNDVLAPKCYGAQILDSLTLDDPLEFFILFSSLASVIGNVGQSDYAFANAYLDQFAVERHRLCQQGKRRGRSISINWPAWPIGLGVDNSTIQHLFQETGMSMLTVDEGINAFKFALSKPNINQLLVFTGDKQKFIHHIHFKPRTAPDKPIETQDSSYRKDDIVEPFLKRIFANVLHLREDEIISNESWDIYNLDSIMILDMTRELEKIVPGIPKTIFFEHKSISDLAGYLISQYGDEILPKLTIEQPNSFKISNNSEQIKQKSHHSIDSKEINSNRANVPIAIIGLSGQYPMAEDIGQFWKNLKSGRDCIAEVPQDRWRHEEYFSAQRNQPGKTYAKWGGFLEDIECFDPLFFNISPKEAEHMDPQERLFLQTAWLTIEDAGYNKQCLLDYFDRQVGVFVGAMWSEYQLYGIDTKGHAAISLGASHASIANRVSYSFDITGPSIAIDTMCSSSLTAIHLACESIRNNECKAAIAGGVNLSLHPNKYIQMAQGLFASSDGRCRSFGEGGDGYVPGEGVGAIFLKPLEQAINDGDHIYATIIGSVLNHGGKTHGYTVPNPIAQGNVIRDVLQRNKIDPKSIQYIEAHGTGTALGDPIEVKGLSNVFSHYGLPTHSIPIGSVKSNIGHLESAAGIAALTKVILQLKHNMIVPSLHSGNINSEINFDTLPFFVPQTLQHWPQQNDLRKAGISSFGAGGANAHIVVQEYQQDNKDNTITYTPNLLVFSAQTEACLKSYVKCFRSFVSNFKEINATQLTRIAYTLQTGREAMQFRLAVVIQKSGNYRNVITSQLDQFVNNNNFVNSILYGKVNLAKQQQKLSISPSYSVADLMQWAKAWTEGVAINWSDLYLSPHPLRESLPGYVFAKERYWVSANKFNTHFQKLGFLHELIHENISTLEQQAFRTLFTGNEIIFKDHQINNQSILPGAALIEMVRIAGEISFSGKKVTAISNIQFLQPIVSNNSPVELITHLYVDHDESFCFEVEWSNNNNPMLCCRGSLLQGDKISGTQHVDIEKLNARCHETQHGTICYEEFASHGILYGPFFKRITQIKYNNSEVLATLKDSDFTENNQTNKIRSISILDAALHSLGKLLFYHDDNPKQVFVPYSIDRLYIIGDFSKATFAYGKIKNRYHDSVILDLSVIDQDGNILVYISQITAKPFNNDLNHSNNLSKNDFTKSNNDNDKKNDAALNHIKDYLKGILSMELKLSAQRMDDHLSWEYFGIDSVTILNLTNHLEKRFIKLPKTLFFEYKNLTELAGYFKQFHSDKFSYISSKHLSSEATNTTTTIKHRFIKSNKSIDEIDKHDVAIIGISGRYPMADSINDFWDNISKGKDCISEIPKDRWDFTKYYNPDRSKSGFSYSKWGGFLSQADHFDSLFFNISPSEAQMMDPHERIFLETVWKTLEDAAYTPQTLNQSGKVGVYAGVMYQEYQLYGAQSSLEGKPLALSGTSASVANRVSYYFNFNGPSFSLDSMCSSSLTAIHLACEHIKYNVIQHAIAGGVNVSIHPNKYLLLSKGNFLASDGRCRAFGAGGDGYVPGEGVGCVLLKKLSQAIADRDHIYAVIKGSDINHGGHTHGYTVPNPEAQYQVMKNAIKRSTIPIKAINYIETHGTGTALGDPIEVSSLTRIYSETEDSQQQYSIGSVKSNIGHCESASGIAGLTKVLLQMQHKKIAPSLHSEKLNPNIDFNATSIKVQQSLSDWKQISIKSNAEQITLPRSAMINSFGAGGSNACLVVQEYNADHVKIKQENTNERFSYFIPLSAKTNSQLNIIVTQLFDYIQSYSQYKYENDIQNKETIVVEKIRFTAADILSVNEEDLDKFVLFSEYGLDKQQALLLWKALSESLSLEIPKKWLLQPFSIQTLADRINSVYFSKYKKIEIQNLNISDLAYTLQIGRVTQKKRLIFIVTSLQELSDTLECYINNKSISCEYYCNNNSKENLINLFDEKELNLLIEQWIKEKSYTKLARLWAAGTNIPWHTLNYEGLNKPRRINLPTYPFERKRCWFETESIDKVSSTHITATSKLTPLIHSNISSLKIQKFFTSVTADNIFLSEHVIKSQSILPASAYLEMGFQACYLSDQPVFSGKNIMWLQPMFLEKHEQQLELETLLYPESNAIRFEIKKSNSNSSYCQGYWLIGENSQKKRKTEIDTTALKQTDNIINKTRFYKIFSDFGFEYGKTFQTIIKSYMHDDVALSEFQLSESLINSFQQYRLHPSVIDAAFQSTLATLIESSNIFQKQQFLPFSIRELTCYQTIPIHGFIYVNNQRWINKKSGMLSFDVSILNAQGEFILSMMDFTLRAIPQSQPEIQKEKKQNIYYAAPGWKKESIKNQSLQHDVFTFLFLTPELINLQNDILEKTKAHKLVILPQANTDSAQAIQDQYACLYNVVQSTLKDPNKQRVNICAIFHKISPQYRMLSGLLNTAHLENPKLSSKIIYLLNNHSTQKETETLATLIKEINFWDPKIREVKLHISEQEITRSIWYWQLLPIDFIRETNKHINNQINRHATYWISGGLGGVGRAFISHFTSFGQPNLIISGRSPLDEKIQNELNKLTNDTNAKLNYISCDVSNSKALEGSYEYIKQHYGNINGIVHSAGVLNDSVIVKKTLQSSQPVLQTKVDALIALDRITCNENLDFIILFSSLAAVNGNLGQADYASANAFMDAFAAYRNSLQAEGKRSGKTISINWPLWRDGGMHVNAEMERWILEKTGFIPITHKQGFEIFDFALNANLPQLAAFCCEGKQAFEILNIHRETDELIVAPTVSLAKKKHDKVDVKWLIEILSEILQIESYEFDPDTELSEYGVDSIQMMSILNRLEKYFEQPLDPNTIVLYPTIRKLTSYLSQLGFVPPNSKIHDKSDLKLGTLKAEPATIRKFISSNSDKSNKIAIIGYSGRFPGSSNADAFWNNLVQAKELITTIPENRWSLREYFTEDKTKTDKSFSKYGGFLDRIDYFDPEYFNISPNHAVVMDPQQRIMLMLTQHLIDHAGYHKDELSENKTSLFLGAKENNYLRKYHERVPQEDRKHNLVSSLANMISGRIANFYNLQGNVTTIDTACSSSLVAVHHACKSLIMHESDMAIAGGICLILDPYLHISFSQASVLTERKHCSVFDENANGFVLGEAAALVMLKRYEDACEEGDRILGIISGSAVNNDGYTMGLTVPNQNAQKDVLQLAYKDAGITPDKISYLEAHGTGTLLGDPIEVKAATEVFRNYSDACGYCAIGSVKSNIGHTMTAAGISSLIKVILALQYKQIPPTLHCHTPHPRFLFDTSPFYPNTQLIDWAPRTEKRYAGVSSFGFGGTNTHVVVEEEINSHEIKRQSIPPTKFNEKQYWLGSENKANMGSAEDIFTNILDNLQDDKIDIEEAMELLDR